MMRLWRLPFLLLLLPVLSMHAQTFHTAYQRYYAPLNSWVVFAEYSNSSSHIILGDVRQRKFAGFALDYQRRISANRWMAWDYAAEIRPLLVESDPTLAGRRITYLFAGNTGVIDAHFPFQVPIDNVADFPDQSFSGTLTDGTPYTEEIHNYIGRRWTYTPGISPVGFSVHLVPLHRLQPFFAGSGGFVVSPRDIPTFKSSAFNFTFTFGGGVEWFRDRQHSWTLEYRVQHLSSKDIGSLNPGIDSQFIRVGYRFKTDDIRRLFTRDFRATGRASPQAVAPQQP